MIGHAYNFVQWNCRGYYIHLEELELLISTHLWFYVCTTTRNSSNPKHKPYFAGYYFIRYDHIHLFTNHFHLNKYHFNQTYKHVQQQYIFIILSLLLLILFQQISITDFEHLLEFQRAKNIFYCHFSYFETNDSRANMRTRVIFLENNFILLDQGGISHLFPFTY